MVCHLLATPKVIIITFWLEMIYFTKLELSNIFFVDGRLRQACDHVSLTVKNKFDESEIEFESDKVTSEGAVSDKVNICILAQLLQIYSLYETHQNAELVSHGSVEQIQNDCSRCPP